MVFLRTICPVFLFLIGIVPGLFAADFELLPVQTPFFSASSLDFRSYLFTGSENDRLVNHGNLGLDYPLVGYGPRDLTVGIAAAVHLVMYPEHLKWPVDNLYATLATYIGYVPSSWLTLRLFPVYHVSGHLADGTTDTSGPNSLKDPEAVSAEMVKLESDITPLHGLSLSIGYGRYYHVCSLDDSYRPCRCGRSAATMANRRRAAVPHGNGRGGPYVTVVSRLRYGTGHAVRKLPESRHRRLPSLLQHPGSGILLYEPGKRYRRAG